MDDGEPWKGNPEFLYCMFDYTCIIYAVWIYGSLCDCHSALEIIEAYHDLFPDWYDDSGTLCIDTIIYPVLKNRTPYITFSLPITIYILVGFFAGIPRELFEAACIDGCSVYRMFTHVALPLAKTGFMVTGLMSFVANWNELLLAMVFISKEAKKTLPVSLTKFVGPYNTNYCQMFAAIVLAIIPTVVVYCCFSNNIVDGLTQGAVKG